MSRKSIVLCLGTVLVLVSGISAGLYLLVRHEPAFYQHSAVPTGLEQKRHSDEFLAELTQFVTGAVYEKAWGAKFTEAQINAYLDEDFRRALTEAQANFTLHKSVPEGIRAPRVALRTDEIRLGFRYGVEPWSTVITIVMRPWLVPSEPNVVAVELRGVYAGALPISAQSLLEGIAEAARQNNIEVIWYRHSGYPVAVLRFQADHPHPTVQLQRLVLQPGLIEIAGRAIEAAPLRAALLSPAAN